jgi:pimeloyl-ACP methyl ester carboxylesterase
MMRAENFVLIRGLVREARHWGIFPDILHKQFPSTNILTPDIPGNGWLHDITSPKTIDGMTEALRKQLPVRNQLKLIALSMGGMIAIDWMIRYPEEIHSVVLINTSARPFSPFYHRLRWAIYLKMMQMIFRSPHKKEADILALTSNRHGYDRELLEFWRQWQQQYPVSTASARNQFCAAAKFYVATKPQQPILIVTSKADRLVDCRCSLRLRHSWKTDYAQHDTAGHDLPLDEPVWLADTIGQWVGKLSHHP